MTIFIIVTIFFGVFIYIAVKIAKWMITSDNEFLERCGKQKSDKEITQNAKRMMALLELRRQAEAVGDDATLKSINNMTYHGSLPQQRNDGAWLSLYDNLRILKIAGMNYRGNLSAYVGSFRGILKSEPTNEYDSQAIMVKCEDGKHIGYIREDQTELARNLMGVWKELPRKSDDFKPYRITGYIWQRKDVDGRQFFDGCVYIVKNPSI